MIRPFFAKELRRAGKKEVSYYGLDSKGGWKKFCDLGIFLVGYVRVWLSAERHKGRAPTLTGFERRPLPGRIAGLIWFDLPLLPDAIEYFTELHREYEMCLQESNFSVRFGIPGKGN